MVDLHRQSDHARQFVVTTTDYLPGHSEQLTISKVDGKGTVTFMPGSNGPTRDKISDRQPIGDEQCRRFTDAGMDPNLITNGAEIRAAVALLTRSIRIVSAARAGRRSRRDGARRTGNRMRARAKCQSAGEKF